MLKIGDKIQILVDDCRYAGINKGDIVTVLSLVNYNYNSFPTIGFKCNYNGEPNISSGLQPNWTLREGEHYIKLSRYINQPESLKGK